MSATRTFTYVFPDETVAADCIATLARSYGYPEAAEQDETEFDFVVRKSFEDKKNRIKLQKTTEQNVAYQAQLESLLESVTVEN